MVRHPTLRSLDAGNDDDETYRRLKGESSAKKNNTAPLSSAPRVLPRLLWDPQEGLLHRVLALASPGLSKPVRTLANVMMSCGKRLHEEAKNETYSSSWVPAVEPHAPWEPLVECRAILVVIGGDWVAPHQDLRTVRVQLHRANGEKLHHFAGIVPGMARVSALLEPWTKMFLSPLRFTIILSVFCGFASCSYTPWVLFTIRLTLASSHNSKASLAICVEPSFSPLHSPHPTQKKPTSPHTRRQKPQHLVGIVLVVVEGRISEEGQIFASGSLAEESSPQHG